MASERRVELLAMALAAEEASGHNDHPLYDDYDEATQKMFRDRAEFILKALDEQGYSLIQHRVVR